MSVLTACHLGETPFRAGLALQQELVDARAAGETGDWLLFPDHSPVLTVGRNPSAGNLKADAATLAARGIEVFEVSRGGDVTWHGPGQLVAYPIVELTRCDRDLHRFLRALEGAVIDTLAHWNIHGERSPGRTGVWVDGEKIASIGIAVRRWVSYHGVALNVAPNLEGFDLIHPCGLQGIRMTSMAGRLGAQAPTLSVVRQRFTLAFAEQLGYSKVVWSEAPAVASNTVRDVAAPPLQRSQQAC